MSLNVFSFPSAGETSSITKGPGGNLFFTETAADKIGEITTAGVVTEFSIPTPNALPTSIITGPDGNLYFTESGVTNGGFGALQIGRLAPTGKITEFSLGLSVFAVGGITAGPDGNVYFAVGDNHGEQVGRITPAGNISFLAVPGGINPGVITTGPDGNLWVADPDDGQIIRLAPATDAATTFALPSGNLGFPGGITAGPDGNIWFTDTSFIGRITTKGAITEFALPTKDSRPGAITAGPDGNLYFAESSPGAGIGRITTSGVITEVPVPASGGIAAGPDGNIWVTEDGKVARFVLDGKPANPSLNQFAVPAGTEISSITKGPNGNLFFTETAADKIGEITTAGVVTEFSIPTQSALPTGITTGPDGNVYFIESGITNGGFGTLHIGRLAPTGKITEFSLGLSVFAVGGITAGPDGNVYFTVGDNHGEQVGRITPAGNISFLAVPGGINPGAITTGPDGNLWVTDPDDGQIIRLTPATDAATTFALPSGNLGSQGGITTGPDGNIWFTGTSFIGRITTKGVIAEFALPNKDSSPGAITAGADGNLYFAESSPGAGIGRITTSGVITEIPVPASGGIAAGPDGNIWVTEDGKVAKFLIAQPPVASPSVAASFANFASDTVTNPTTHGATVDAAIEALFPGDQPGSVTASRDQLVVVSSTTLFKGHKRLRPKE